MIDTPAPIDHVELGLTRPLSQFESHTKFIAFLKGLLAISNGIEACYQQMLDLPNVDTQIGANLDTIGIIVGADRHISDVVVLSWFGFDDTGAYATCFGEETDISVGSRFFEEGEVLSGTTILGDVEYRMLIKCKIVKNNSSSTPEEIINGLRLIFGVPDVKLTEGVKSISISIGRPVLAFEQAMIVALDILPRPAGIPIVGAVTSYIPPGTGYTGGTEGEDY